MFTLSPLPYTYTALEPAIDAKTVEIHYTKHHQTYCDKLNAGLEWTEYSSWVLEDLLTNINSLPDNLKPVVRNHGGGLLNHTIYWETMIAGGSKPGAEFQQSIVGSFGSWAEFEKQYKDKALALFGSGWTWLEKDWDNLIITNYPNQENPLMYWKLPLLGIDVWEHAYYLHYQNRRVEYINGRRSLINWAEVEKKLS